tara:strand:+ start:845 stop:1204 length:360 start_codon:yes stop_codon:yes gene_type:complete
MTSINRYSSLSIDGINNNKFNKDKPLMNVREKAYHILSNKDQLKCKLAKTKMCKIKNCKRIGCSYAHSISELKVRECLFGDECIYKNSKNNPCKYIHPNESMSDYHERTSVREIKKIIL